VDEVTPLVLPDYPSEHAWHLFIIRLDIEKARMSRDDFMAALKQRGIGTGLHFRAVHTQKYYREMMPESTAGLPDTQWSSERICSLPLFPDMAEADLQRVVNAIKSILKESSP
jgi:UDP-4-amino-4-deoxy-L-arabinose-oxoglutarate aminotransferase